MSFNPELQAFLQVPEEQLLSISPHRSGSPHSLLDPHTSPGSTIGGFRSRARAGTLPSSLYPGSNTQPPFQLEIPLGQLSLGPSSMSMALNPELSGGKQRMRSGSLFGVTDSHSIWSNDSSQHIPLEEPARARAYSTNHALLNEQPNFHLQQFTVPEHHPSHFELLQEQNRPRAQTFISRQETEPLLLEHIDHRLLNWTSSYSDLTLGPTSTLIVSNLPPHATSAASLASLLSKFGKLLTVRVFTGNESALVEFESLEAAMQARAQLHHQELLPGFSCQVAFAKIFPPQQSVPQVNPPVSSVSTIPQVISLTQVNQPTIIREQQPLQTIPQNISHTPQQQHIAVDLHSQQVGAPPKLADIIDDILRNVRALGVDTRDGFIPTTLNKALIYTGKDTELGPLPEPIQHRDFDAPKLRETRKLIDYDGMSKLEIEELALAMLDELPELSSDYLGNTVVQKLFEHCSSPVKVIMLKRVSEYLAQMGAHKNGTWSAQKMITVAASPLQKKIVAESLQPYCGPLFNDQFGNYVIQCTLKFGAPWNNFIFEAILAKFWLIVRNRFGARAVRACLESNETTSEQAALVSAVIVSYAEHLAIDPNAALLVTWFLDTCTLPNRYNLITSRLLPRLAQLCTHKLGSLTVLKILNNRNEAEGKGAIITAVFGEIESRPPALLEHILQDANHGATFIFKVLTNPQLDPELRWHLVSQVRKVLQEINVGNSQSYKRLFEEVGVTQGQGQRHSRTHSTSGGNARKGKNKSPYGKGRQQTHDQQEEYTHTSYQQMPQQPPQKYSDFQSYQNVEMFPFEGQQGHQYLQY